MREVLDNIKYNHFFTLSPYSAPELFMIFNENGMLVRTIYYDNLSIELNRTNKNNTKRYLTVTRTDLGIYMGEHSIEIDLIIPKSIPSMVQKYLYQYEQLENIINEL